MWACLATLGRGPCQLHYVYGPGLVGPGPAPCGELKGWLDARWGAGSQHSWWNKAEGVGGSRREEKSGDGRSRGTVRVY